MKVLGADAISGERVEGVFKFNGVHISSNGGSSSCGTHMREEAGDRGFEQGERHAWGKEIVDFISKASPK